MRRLTSLSAALAAAGIASSALAASADAQGLIGRWGSVLADKDPTPGRFGDMIDLDVDSRGYVYVLDELSAGPGRVQKFTTSGKLVRQFGVPADEDDRYDADEIVDAIADPTALGVGPDRNVYVAESGERTRISVWSPLGRYLRSFASGGSGPGQIGNVEAIDFTSSGEVLVSDSGNDRIGRFGPGGNWVGELPISSRGIGSIGANLYVALGDEVAVLTPPSTFTRFGGATDTSDGLFGTTSDIATTGDTVYVADSRMSRILAFDPAGSLKGAVGQSPGSQPGQLTEPNAIATDCRGTLYVADAGNHRVQRFGAPGAAACGDVRKDKQERLVIRLAGKRQLRFREAFAVTPVVSCDRPCKGTLSGRIVIRGRKEPILLTSEPIAREFPGPAVSNIAPTERGTDIVVAALERRQRMTAAIRLVVRDLTGRKVVRTRTYELR
ncbi:NHL repeat-containing protein [Conexibacter sp. CPCC 206217]|uniref:NHL repeat-containing protein n=1 Tax=Conexibacter sp. CPCC 206217 TaxID=3064574 RepID=UPI00271B09BC|nr:NHL repeat-containing protein [Conexibacter sp. CPCC 206217]MDO8210199.1 NHL repeat-containing protein [Conexibacter sp. CPCC 206217]